MKSKLAQLLFSLLCLQLSAQHVRFRHLTVEEGLSQNTVGMIHQDQKGFMWIGTYDGLNRYDGHSFLQWKFKPGDTTSVAGNAVKSVYEDSLYLWFGTLSNGMFRIEKNTGKIKNYVPDTLSKTALQSEIIHDIEEYEPGKLWIATSDGLHIFDKKTEAFECIKSENKSGLKLLSPYVRAMTRDQNACIWLAQSGSGITCYNPKQKSTKHFTASPPSVLSNTTTRAIFCDSRGWIWISQWIYGQQIIDSKTGKLITFDSPAFNKISMISQYMEDSKGNIWMATAESGLVCFNPKTAQIKTYVNNPDDPESLSDNTLFSLYEDKGGLIWCGSWKGGVNILNPKLLYFGLLKHNSKDSVSIGNNKVQCFAGKNDQEVYVGTNASIYILNLVTKSFRPLPIDEGDGKSLRHNSSINHILQDDDSSLWICTGGGGLYRYDAKKNKYENFIYGPNADQVPYHTLSGTFKDSKGRLWVLTSGGGLCRYDYPTKTFPRYVTTSASISCMLERKDGLIWLGTTDGGVYLFDPEKGKELNQKPLFADEGITALYRAKNGVVWAGTALGLGSFNESTAEEKLIEHKDAVFSSLIYAVNEDNSANLWFSSSSGLCRFNPVTNESKLFYTHDGLQGREFVFRSVYKTRGGFLLFGGLNGLNYFLPEEITPNSKSPAISLTSVSVQNETRIAGLQAGAQHELTLDYSDYFFTLDFADLDFSSGKNELHYFLHGFNSDWVNAGRQRSITFTNLDPGEYLLEVKLINADGFASEQPVQLTINITPPFWRTAWFYVLCGATAIAGFIAFVKIRERKLLQTQQRLEKQVKLRTAELSEEKQKVEHAHKDIRDSIQYARNIQVALLPAADLFKSHFAESFILFKPKDIVSGDFYYLSEHNTPEGKCVFLAVADCTGHGVPGGFMTMLGQSLLNETINEKQIFEPAAILNHVRERIISSLKQSGKAGESKDGMDIALVRYNRSKKSLTFSGANNPAVIIAGSELKELTPDKQPVGIYGDTLKPFTSTTIQVSGGETLYLFTDGYADQFGGEKGKKLKYKNFISYLREASAFSAEEQQALLDQRIEAWRGNNEQIDDILVAGIRF